MTEYYTTAVLHWQAAIRLFVMKCSLNVTKCFAMVIPKRPKQKETNISHFPIDTKKGKRYICPIKR